MDPKGVLEMLIVFLEERGLENLTHPVLDNSQVICRFKLIKHQQCSFLTANSNYVFLLLQDDAERITPFLGTWKGRSVTKRSGVYGATLSEADTVAVLEMNDKGQVVQVHNIVQHSYIAFQPFVYMKMSLPFMHSGYFFDIGCEKSDNKCTLGGKNVE